MLRKKHGFWILRMIFILLLVVGIAIIAVYPFYNRNLTIQIVSDGKEYVIEKTNWEIKYEDCSEIVFENVRDSVLVKKIRIYGDIQTLLLKEIGYNDFYTWIVPESMENVQWTEDGISLGSIDGNDVRVSLSDAYTKILQRLSASYLQERILMAGFYACLLVFLFFGCLVLYEKKAQKEWNYHGVIYEIHKFSDDIKRYLQYMVYAARTDLKAEVANSYLNRLWWLLEPFFNMLVYVIVFGSVMGNSVENYATFIFSALLMWNFFSKTVNYSVKLVRNNKDIITKVYIPKFILLLSNMILNFMKLLFSMIVLVVMMVIFRVQIGVHLFWILPAYGVVMLLAFGAGMIFLHFGVYVDDLSYAVGILLNMLMFLSGIFYDVMTTLPEPLNIILMCLNPIAMAIDTMRNALLENAAANLPILGMWFLISLILCGIGVHTVYKNENSYVKIV